MHFKKKKEDLQLPREEKLAQCEAMTSIPRTKEKVFLV